MQARNSEPLPPYSVPTMAEVEAIPWNGFRVVSTFSGCGGSCLGYRMAGFRVVWANEFIPEAQRTYKENHRESILDTRDVRLVQPEEILAATGLSKGELDLFDGSPPCSSFSLAGSREDGWGKVKPYSDTKQRTDDLFLEYIRLLRGLAPKVFVAENVAGLAVGSAKGHLKEFLREFEASGYDVRARVLDAQWLGVPQRRGRTIFVGVRKDLGLAPAFPSPFPERYTLGEALARARSTEEEIAEASLEGYATGREWRKLSVGDQSARYFNLIRCDPKEPSPTITQTAGQPGAACAVHPHECRKFTVPEIRSICSFPEDFVLTGTYRQRVERMGRSVPPLMMRAVASTVRDEILRRASP